MGFTWFYHGFWIFFDIFGPPNSSGFHFTTCSFDQFAENLREMGWNQCSQSRFLWPKSSRNLATADTADTGALGFVSRIMIFHDFPWFSQIKLPFYRNANNSQIHPYGIYGILLDTPNATSRQRSALCLHILGRHDPGIMLVGKKASTIWNSPVIYTSIYHTWSVHSYIACVLWYL